MDTHPVSASVTTAGPQPSLSKQPHWGFGESLQSPKERLGRD